MVRTQVRGESKHLQQSQLKITMDLGLERDLNIQVQVQPQPEGVTLAAAAAAPLLLERLAADLAQCVGDAAAQVLRGLADAVHAAEWAALLPLHHLVVLLALAPVGALWWWLVLFLGARVL